MATTVNSAGRQIRQHGDRIHSWQGRIRAVVTPVRHPAMATKRRPAPAQGAPTGRLAPPSPSSPATGLLEARSGDGEGEEGEMVGSGAAARGSPTVALRDKTSGRGDGNRNLMILILYINGNTILYKFDQI
jgi:hypothetical protein